MNRAVADFCRQAPDRLVPVMTAALHLPALAVRQLRTAVEDLGAVGVQISTTAAPGVELDHPSLFSSGRRQWRWTRPSSYIRGAAVWRAP